MPALARTSANKYLRRPLYATDRVVELVRSSVGDLQTRLTDLQQSINKLDREPQALRVRAVEAVSAQADALAREAQAASHRDRVSRERAADPGT